MEMAKSEKAYRLVFLKQEPNDAWTAEERRDTFAVVTQEGNLPTCGRAPESAIAQIVQVSKMARKRQMCFLWGYRYADLPLVSTVRWSALDVHPKAHDHSLMKYPLPEIAHACGCCTTKLPTGLLQCPPYRARIYYGHEGIREAMHMTARRRRSGLSPLLQRHLRGLRCELPRPACWRARWVSLQASGEKDAEQVPQLYSKGHAEYNTMSTTAPSVDTIEKPQPMLEGALERITPSCSC